MLNASTPMRRRFVASLYSTAAVLLGFAGIAEAANPRANSLMPYSGQVGTTVDIVIQGERLEDAEEILCLEPGLTFAEIVATPDKGGRELKAKVAVDANSPFGRHRLRVRTRSGITQVVNFFVGPYPVVNEVEPNSDFASPQKIEKNVTVQGRITNEDVDYFVVTAQKGERISAEVEGLRIGSPAAERFFDPYIAIMNESRFELVAADDHALTKQDGFVSLIAPEDGNYIIQLRDSSYGGGAYGNYRLHVGNFARPSGVFPAGGQPGETVNVRLLGDPAGEFEQAITIPARAPLDFGIFPTQNGLVTPTPNPLWISSLPNVLEVEPNETLAQATPFPIPGAANGVVSSPEDLDYFKFTMKKDQEVEIDVIARRARSSIDSVVDVYNANGGRIAGDDDRKRPDSALRFKAPADGDYYVKVRDQLGNGGPDYFYRIEISPVQPSLGASVADIARYVQPNFIVPQGRRMAVLVNIQRENFGGAVTFSGENLPAGATVTSPETWASDATVPLMFYAAADAPLGGSFATIQGTWQNPANAEQKVSGNLTQSLLVIRALNNRVFWEESFDAVPVVVAEKSPYDIQVVVPKVPIVRGGLMSLKVVATRDEGFDEPIAIELLQNAPGINSSRTIVIAKGETEAVIPLNANGNAPLRESAMTVKASATVGNGPVQICSELFPLKVAEKYMNLKYNNTAVDQGEEVEFLVEIEHLTPFEGEATVEFIGLPPKTTTVPQTITKDSKQIVFPIKAEADAPIGETKNMYCKITVMQDGEPIVHQIGEGRLRVNKPAPVITNPKPAETPAPQAQAKPEEKPKVLSRIEKLRLQQEAIRAQAESQPAQ